MVNNRLVNTILFILAFTAMLVRAFIYTDNLPVLHYFCLACKAVLIPVAVILTLRTPGKLTGIDLSLLVYGAAMYLSCLINHTGTLSLTLLSLDIFIIWALCRWFFVRQSLFPLKVISSVLLVFIALNFALLLWRPYGLWVSEINGVMYYLLGGNYNSMGKAFFIATVTYLLLLRLLPQPTCRREAVVRLIYRILFGVTVILSLSSLLIVGSKTSMVGLLLVLAFGALLFVPNKVLRLSCLTAFVALYFVLQLWAVYFDMNKRSQKAEFIVEDVLRKDMTFTERTFVWERAEQLIRQRPVIGYGTHPIEWYQQELGVLTTHNLVLHILLKGGWIALAAFILLVVSYHVRLLRPVRLPQPLQQRWADARFILLFGLWIFLFMMIVEVYPFSSIAILLIYAGWPDRCLAIN